MHCPILSQGKFIRINFDASGFISGANIESCILLDSKFGRKKWSEYIVTRRKWMNWSQSKLLGYPFTQEYWTLLICHVKFLMIFAVTWPCLAWALFVKRKRSRMLELRFEHFEMFRSISIKDSYFEVMINWCSWEFWKLLFVKFNY